MDGLMAFPAMLLAIALMAWLGPSLRNVVLALRVVYTPASPGSWSVGERPTRPAGPQAGPPAGPAPRV